MESKKILSKKFFIQLAIGIILLCLLVLIYFTALSYFHKCILANRASGSEVVDLEDLDDTNTPIVEVATSTSIVEKINDKLLVIYSFFFSLPIPEELVSSNEKDNSVLYLGSFPYTSAIVDNTKTSLRFDGTTNAIMFPLNYEWLPAAPELVEANKNKFNGYKVNSFKGPFEDRRCLQNNCLEYKGNKLVYNGKVLSFPSGIKASEIYAVSLGNISDRFIVGFTLKGGEYKSEVFYFTDSKFTKIPNFKTITSAYPGLLGFGGESDDFLIVYGAYKGQAFRIRGNKVTDLDQFVSYRAMNNGFKPEVIRAKSDNYVNWYIYSSSSNNPQIVKLWPDDSGEIVGATSFLKDLDIKGQSAEFKLLEVKSSEVLLLAHIKNDNHDVWQVLKDRGFKNDKSASLITLPVYYDVKKTEVFIKKIYNSEIDLDNQGQSLVKVNFSINSDDWQEVKWGQNIDFKQDGTKVYFLKVLFLPASSRFYSPYIGSIIFSYVCNI